MIYINKTAKDFYVELDSALDKDSNLIGSTWDEYQKGYWIPLTEEQLAFKDNNPNASVQEVFNMELEDVEIPITPVVSELVLLRDVRLKDIEDTDDASNIFYISVLSNGIEVANKEFWIDKDLRNSLYSITLPSLLSDGETKTRLWTITTPPESIEVPISWAMEKLQLLEIYAKRTYDRKAENEAAVYTAYNNEDVDTLKSIDVAANYPLPLTFELNLDLYE